MITLREGLTFGFLCLVPFLFCAGCGRDGGEAEEKKTVDVGSPRRDFSFAAGGKVALPASIPEDVPLYPGGLLKMAREVEGRNPEATVILGVPLPPTEVIDYYFGKMKELGWQLLGDASVDGQRYISFRQGKRFVTVTVTPEGGESLVGVVYLVKNF